MINGAGFNILMPGLWSQGQIQLNLSEKWAAKTSPGVQPLIDAAWRAAKERAELNGQRLFSSDLIGLRRYRGSGDRLVLDLGTTTYKDYIGTNLNRAPLEAALAPEPVSAYLANPLGTCAAVISSDQKLLIGMRSGKTFEYPNHYHMPGGNVEIGHVQAQQANAATAICDELFEEFSIAAADMAGIHCTGLAEHATSKKPELTFLVEIKSEHSLIFEPANEEHSRLQWIDATPASLTTFLVDENHRTSPAGKACLLLFGRAWFGLEWFAEVNGRMLQDWPQG